VHRIEVSQRIAAPRERVWAILADHEGMKRWSPVREVIRRRPGAPDPNGEGAIRTVRASGMVFDERITAFKAGERMEYVLVEGAPIRDHNGEVVLLPDGDATRVVWRVSFRPLIPGTGWLLERLLRKGLTTGLEGLRKLAETNGNEAPRQQRETA
jgi:uncharacterized protein YndB with AHSA1/START domain